MKAIIMAGGEGKRLRPLTCTMPKPMVPLLNKPIIERCVDLLALHGFKDVAITLHYLPNAIRSHLGSGERLGVDITYMLEETPLGTAGSVGCAAGDRSESVLVISGDALTDIDLSKVVKAHESSGAAATIVLKKVDAPTEYGVALTDEKGFITRFIEKPSASEVFSDLANTGIYVLSAEALQLIPEYMPYDFSRDLFPRMMSDGMKLYGFEADGYWSDVGDIQSYVTAQIDMLDGRVRYKTRAKVNDGVYMEEGAKVSPRAVLTGPCYISSGVEIADNAYFGAYSVANSGVRLDAFASVKRSVLMEGVRVRANAEIRGAVICEGAHLDTGASAFEGAVLGARVRAGKGCTVSPGVLIWPEKELEHDVTYSENRIWTSGGEAMEPKRPEQGYADFDMTPENAVRIGASFASIFPLPADIAITTDGTQQSVMLKYALIAGMVSQGADVYDAGVSTRSAFGHAVRTLGLHGGIYVRVCRTDKREICLELLDSLGSSLDTEAYRRFCQQYGLGEKQPLTYSRLGIVQRYSGANKGYEATLAHICRSNMESVCAVIAGDAAVYDSVARVALPKGANLKYISDTAREAILSSMARANACMGFIVKQDDELPKVFVGEREVSRGELIALLAAAAAERGMRAFTLPVSLPREYSEWLTDGGASVSVVAEARSKREHEAFRTDTYLQELFEPEAAIARLLALHADGALEPLIESMPTVYTGEREVGCTWREVGRMLRSLVETEKGGRVELIDGVSISDGDGWVLVKPNPGFTACRIITGSYTEEYAKELSDIYLDKLKHIADERRKKT